MTKKHFLLMIACCVVPIAALIILGALAIPMSSVVPLVVALLCPLMMFFMMRGMGHDHETHHAHSSAPDEKRHSEESKGVRLTD